jgi:ribosomal protein L35
LAIKPLIMRNLREFVSDNIFREGWREGKKTLKRTLANLSHWPAEKIQTLRRLLRDETLVSPQDLFTTRQTLPHGHVEASNSAQLC